MNRKSLLKKFLYSSWFLAFIPVLVIAYFMPQLNPKFELLIEETGPEHATSSYHDLNSDGISEIITSGKGIPYFHVLVRDNNMNIYDQWNFPDNFSSELSNFFFGNYDNDNYDEIYVFTYSGDSLFINLNEFMEPGGTLVTHNYITRISIINQAITSSLGVAGFYDRDSDGFDELYFSIWTGFGLEPRRLYCYNFISKKLMTSEFTGIICQNPCLEDSDEDKKPEIFGFMSASGNYNDVPSPFTDRSAWLMVLDEDLKFEFPPVEFPGFTNQMATRLIETERFKAYMLTLSTGSADTSITPRIMLYSTDGKLIKERPYSEFINGNSVFESAVIDKKRIFLFGDDIVEMNSDLDVINKEQSPFSSDYRSYIEDINLDGTNEIICVSHKEDRLVIFNTSLQIIAENDLVADWNARFSHLLSNEKGNKFFISTGGTSYLTELKKNEYYYLGYLKYPGIYILVLFFILIVKRVNTLQIVHRESLKQRLVTLQLQGIKSQLDPHFTFNTLNSVASLIYTHDRESAYDYLNKFTLLLRHMLNDAEKIYRSLREEIEFVTMYLELEKLRFGDKFDYKIEIGNGITLREVVPKLVLQTFAENAVKHGIMPSVKGGMLKIGISKINNHVHLVIEDNGIGRAKAAGQSTSTGKGLKLTNEFYSILNEINKKPIRHDISDLYDYSGEPAGTRVEVWVPDR